jgi:peroxiredoxin family protein
VDKEKFVLVVFSGDMDKVLAAFILATTAASMGMEVKMFFTFWGLNVLRKKKLTGGKNILQKMMNFMNRGGADRLPLSKFNLLGAGPAMMKVLMEQAKVPSIEEFLEMSKKMGIKLLVCTTTFGFMGHKKEDFIDGIDEYCGAATYLQEAKEAKVSYFI